MKKNKKKENKKKRKINYFNKEILILLFGLFIFLSTFFYKILFLEETFDKFTFYIFIISFVLVYFALLIFFITSENKLFLKSLSYIKKSKNFIYFSFVLFLFFSLIGFLITPPEFLISQILEILQEILAQTEGMSSLELICFIFFNNLKSTLLAILLGIFLGILPIMSSISNGYLLGFVSSSAVKESSFFELWKLFPHGIFELPAVFISIGLGLKLGTFFLRNNKKDFLRDNLLKSFEVFILIVIPLLMIAAIIEGIFIALS